MPIVVVCPSCGHQLRAGNELAGRAALCPACRSVLSVPSQPGAWDPFAMPDSATMPDRLDVSPASQPRHPVWLLPVVLGGSCVFLLAAALLTSSLRKAGHVAAARADQPGAVKRDPLPPDFGRPQPAGAGAGQPAAPPRPPGRVAPPPARAPAPVVWKVEVDPPPSPVQIARQANIRLVAPGKGGPAAVLYPDVPSSIIAVGNTTGIGGGVWEIWDLSSMTRSARLKGRLPSKMAAISPDGAYLATAMASTKVLIWDVKSNEPLGEVEVGPFLETLAFPSTNRLVAGGRGGALTLWHLPDGEVERDIKLPRRRDHEALAFSPGGRYMAGASDKTLWLYDLDSGRLVGQLPVAADGEAAGIAFSPDGLELAALFERFDDEKVICWDVESGRVVAEVDLGSEVTSRTPSGDYRGRALEWFPDRKRWLAYGRFVIDRRIGKTVWTLPSDAVPAAPRVVIDDERLMLSSGKNLGALTAYNLPQQQIAAASTVIESGGKLADLGMPPLTAADWTGVLNVSLNEAADWQATADPTPTPGHRLLARPMPIRAQDGSLQAVMVARADVAQALVMVAPRLAAHDRKNADGNRATGAAVRLDRYDLRTGRLRDALHLRYHGELVSLSPDGRLALVRTADETNRFNTSSQQDDRLDVYRLDDSAHVAGWRPYRNPPRSSDPMAARHDTKHEKVTAAVFVDSNHVLTMNEPKTLVLWKLPQCRAVYMMQGAEFPSLSPNHKYLAVHAHNSYRFFDSLRGEPRGNLALESRAAASAFHPAGRRFAVVSRVNASVRISCWDITQGQAEQAILLPPRHVQHVHWCGDNHLLLDNAWLVDIALGAVIWKYELSRGRHLEQSPDGRHWFLNALPSGGGPSFLQAANVPGSAEISAAAQARFCVQPGSSLSLSLKLQTPPGRPGFTEEVRRHIVGQLSQSGIQVVTGQAPVVLELSMVQVHTGETREYEISRFRGIALFGGSIDGKKITLPLQKVECRTVVLHEGKPVWEGGTTCTNEVWSVPLEPNESPEARLSKEMWSAAAGYFLHLAPPTRVFAGGSADGLGSSDLAAALP